MLGYRALRRLRDQVRGVKRSSSAIPGRLCAQRLTAPSRTSPRACRSETCDPSSLRHSDPTANAGVRLRIEQQLPELRRLGSKSPCRHSSTRGLAVAFTRGHVRAKAAAGAKGVVRRAADVMRLGRFDLLFVYRESSPFGPPFLERFALRRHLPIVHDFDEAIFIANIHSANRAWAWLRDRGRPARGRNGGDGDCPERVPGGLRRRWNSRVIVIPNTVDTEGRHPGKVAAPPW